MSVLYKALQKAEKENEQRQTTAAGKGFDPERLAGSGAIKLAGGHGVNWRLVGGSVVGLLAILIFGLYFVTKTQPTPGPRVAALTPPKAVTAQPPAPPQTAPQAAASATPQPPAGADAPPSPPAPPPSAQAQPTQVAQAPADASANASPAPAGPQTESAPASAPAPAATEEKPQTAVETQVAKAEPPAPPAKPAEKAVARTPAKPIEIAADSPAQMLNPPISIARADFALSGVGRAVQVREIAQEAQDSVGAGYNALLRGEYDTALGFYDRALAKEPTSVLALLGRGASLQKLHRLDEAQEAYTKALKIDPQNREALTNVTAIFADRSPTDALTRLLDLEKDYPAFSPIKAQIGLLYAKAGTMEPALDYLRRAIALSPESVMYQYDLAIILDRMSLGEQAADAYDRVLSAIAQRQAPPELSSTEIERRVRYLRAK